MKALIDADSLLYKAGFSYEEKTNWNELENELGIVKEPSISITSDIIEARNAIDGLIENIRFKTGCDEIEVWLTGHNNFRYEVLESYKSNRKDSRKPVAFGNLWDYLITHYDALVADDYEADDVVVYKKSKYPDDYFLCAIDKDVLYQTVGTHYNYGNDELITTTPYDSLRFFYYQILKGDQVDGYKGVPNIGHVKANKILDEAEGNSNNLEWEYWTACIKACMDTMKLSKKEAKEYMTVQARMASMHQLRETSKNEYKVVLWKPPKRPSKNT